MAEGVGDGSRKGFCQLLVSSRQGRTVGGQGSDWCPWLSFEHSRWCLWASAMGPRAPGSEIKACNTDPQESEERHVSLPGVTSTVTFVPCGKYCASSVNSVCSPTGPHALKGTLHLGLMLRGGRFEILNSVICEFLFCKCYGWNCVQLSKYIC